jgi:hypothetical protein
LTFADSAGAIRASGAITLQNWTTHPSIVAVDKEVAKINQATLTSATQDNVCSGMGDSSREKLTDAANVVRKLKLVVCGEEHCDETTYHYDASSHLRYALRMVHSIEGAAEERVYFDAMGKRIWDVYRQADMTMPDQNIPDLTTVPFTTPARENQLAISADLSSSPGKVYDAPKHCE